MKNFGAMLVTDHTEAKQQVSDVAKALSVTPPNQPMPAAVEEQNKLSALSGDSFDDEFASYMVEDHQKDIQEFQDEAKANQGQTSALASKQLPVLQKHLQMAQSLSGNAAQNSGSSTTMSATGAAATSASGTLNSAPTQEGPNEWRASKLAGVSIYGPDNKQVGTISDVLINKDGKAEFVIVGVGGFLPTLAFVFASTNLVVELGLVLYLLMGWQFMAAEWIGGVMLVLVLSFLVKLTYPTRLVEEARHHPEAGGAHEHGDTSSEGGSFFDKLSRQDTWVRVAQSFVMDWSMLWKDLVLGFLIAGALSVFVPNGVWQALFVKGASQWVQVPANALLGPIVAVLSFVCSIGNVPLAAVLWGAGVSFGGVLAFLYADLIVLPLLDVYRRYYGWKMAAYIGAVFYATMVISALIMDVAFNALGWIPASRPDVHAEMVRFSLNYTFWLNIIFSALAIRLFVIARRQPMQHSYCEHHAHPVHEHRHN